MRQIYGSIAPPKAKGKSNLKYVITGLILLSGAASLWMFVQMERKEPPPPKEPVPEVPKRINPLEQQEFVIEEEVKPEPEEPEPEVKKRVERRGPWDCSGDLPTTEVRKVVSNNRRQVQTCYERGLKRDNVLQGSLDLKLKVNATGKIVATAVAGTLRDNDVFSCVRTLAEGWSFPEPTGGDCAVLQIPFRFTPAEEN
ncbi:MAG: AgmX/PglI C-terminal domain-containing protein [Deltaproteobacteria bacterium]|nr:AgmX/PglI C-terminal domain-containing protein [Deltaproteobacteria bacterium]